MTAQVKNSNAEQDRSRWYKFTTLLNDIGVAVDYDPLIDTSTKISQLWSELEKLEHRVRELEGHSQSNLAAFDFCNSEKEVA